MKTDISRQPAGLVAATFVLAVLLAAVRSVLAPYTAEMPALSGMPLAGFIDGLLPGTAWRYTVGITVLIINAFLLTRIMIIYKASFGKSYLPFVMYAIAAAGIYFPVSSLSVPLVSLLLVGSSEQAVSSFRRSYRFGAVFNSAFMLGFIPLLYAPGICLAPMLIVTLVIYQRNMRETIVSFAAFFLPFILCSAIWWMAGFEWGYIASAFAGNLTSGNYSIAGVGERLSMPALVLCAAYLIVIIVSIFLLLRDYNRYSNRIRRIYFHFTILFVLSAAMFFIPSADPVVNISVIAVPASVLGTHFYTRLRGLAAGLSYGLIILAFLVSCLSFLMA